MSMQCICTIQSRASRELHEREVDEPGLALAARGQVRNCRVGIQAGMPFGACFWKKRRPASPSRQRFIVNGLSLQMRHDRRARPRRSSRRGRPS